MCYIYQCYVNKRIWWTQITCVKLCF